MILLLSMLGWMAWVLAYFVWPRWSFDDGPFFAEPFGESVADLPTLSSAELSLLGTTVFVLETRATQEGNPRSRTLFVLKDCNGSVRWAKVASTEFGRIQLVGQSAQWFIPGGWIVGIRPEGAESGELYLSPFGGFRFFFHSW